MKAPMHIVPRMPRWRGHRLLWACAILTWCLLPALAFAQGSIFGTVQNANLTNPPTTDLYWVGFLDHTDEEIRIELNTGAGYDGVNWFDDFQNYTTRVAGNPYDFYFINVTNGQGFHLTKPIPANSFQQENILLGPMPFPARPTGLTARVASIKRINISWNAQAGMTAHVYRRATSNNGTFRRLDDPLGSLTNVGVADSFFVDSTSDGATDYTYIIIGQNAAGNFSAHSLTVSALGSAITAPAITSLAPDSGSMAGGTTVTIKGTNFDVAGMSVTFGATAATNVTVLNPFTLTCRTPSSVVSGGVNVVVTNIASALASAPLVNGFRYLGNSKPVLDAIGPKTVAEGANLTFRVHATDPDLTIPILSGVGLPLNATFVDSLNGAGSFVFNPNFTQSGVDTVRIVASDGSLADTQVVVITVTNTNQKPLLDVIGAKTVAEGANLSFRTHAVDPDGNIPTMTAIGVPLNAVFVDSLNGAGSFVFNPDFTQSGSFNVRFVASDGTLADTQLVVVTVTNTNRKPVLDVIGAKTVAEGANLTFRVHAVDPDLNIPTLVAVGTPVNATFVDSLNGAGSFVFNPDFTQAGVFNVSIIASDGTLADTQLVAITVTNVNRKPVLDAIGAKSVAEGANLTFRAHAVDPDLTIPTLVAVGTPLNAVFVDSLNGAGSFVFNPDFTQAGVYNVSIIASDGTLADTQLVVITVSELNRKPVLDVIGAKTVAEGTNLSFRAHAVDPDATIPSLTALGVPLNATFVDSLNGAGSFVFNPDFTQAGVFNVSIIATDGSLADTQLVAITVTNVNRKPVLDVIGAKTVAEGANLTFRVHAVDPDLNIPTLVAVGTPLNATFVDSLNGAGSFVFNPDFFQSGVYNVSVIASDGTLADTQLVAITVTEVDRKPVLDAIGAKSVGEGANLTFRVHAVDPDLTIPTLTAVGIPLNATFVDSLNGAGSFVFNPDFTQAGVYNVSIIASDGTLADTQLVVITVSELNRKPVLDVIGAQTVAEGANLSFRAHAVDPDATIPSLTALGVPLNAAFVDSLNGAGSFVFNPDFTQAGVFNVSIIATDGSLADTQLVAITVTNVNRKPVLDVIGAKTVAEGANLTFRVHAVDPDLNIPTLVAVGTPLNATFVDSLNGAGSFVFNPDFTQSGVYNVSVIASDGTLADTQLVAITVTEVGRKPVLDLIGAKSVGQGSTLSFRTHAVDPDLTIPTLTALNVPLNAIFVDSLNGAGSFVFTPDFTQLGLFNVTFIASDGILADTQLVAITVLATNRKPVLDPIGPQSVAEAANLTFRVHAVDPDATIPSLIVTPLPANATLTDSLNGAGLFVFNPSYFQAGTFNLSFIATDGSLADTQLVVVTVTNVNRPPVLSAIGPQSVNQGSVLSVHVVSTDPDSTSSALTALNVPLNATMTDSLNGRGAFIFSPNFNQAGVYSLTFIASDGLLADSELVTVTVINQGNLPPVFDTLSPPNVNEGETLLVRIHAVDPEGTPVILGLEQAILNAAFVDSGNGAGLLTFMPDYFQAGVDTARILAIDNGTPRASNLLRLIITVHEKNKAPILNPIGNRTVLAGDSLKIRTVATDSTAAPGGMLFMSALNMPANATFQDSGSGIGKFKFKPTFQQIGSYNVTFVATDNGTPSLAALEQITITVQSTNRTPVLNYISPASCNEGDSIKFNVYATDPDGTIPFLRVDTLPKNATFVDSGNGAGTFTFRPNFIQSGLYDLRFTANDGISTASQHVLIQVIEKGNQAPILGPIGALSVLEKSTLTVLISGNDPDFTIPVLSVDTLLENATFVDSGNGNAVFEITPQYWQSGVHTLTFTASDGTVADTEVVTLTILDIGNQLPQFAAFTQPSVPETQIGYFTVAAVDSDQTFPILQARPIPAWAAFADSTNGKGTFTFAPGYYDSGSYSMYVVANDADTPGARDSVLVVLHVVNTNQKPEIDQTSWLGSQPITLVQGQTVTAWLHARDLDGQIPSIRAVSGLVANMVFVDSGNGNATVTFTPGVSQSQQSFTVPLRAIDAVYPADSSIMKSVTFAVTGRNITPILDPIGPKSVVESSLLQFFVTASDSNPGQVPQIQVTDAPTGSSLTFVSAGSSSTQFRFSWTPTYTQSGLYSVLFKARDSNGATDSERVTITVIDAGDQRPQWASSFPVDTVRLSVFGRDSLHVWATDIDNPTLTLTVPNSPRNSTFVDSLNNAGYFRFIPDTTQKDSIYDVLFVASDGILADTGRVIYKLIAFTRGDVNQDQVIDIFDVVYLLDHVFSGGPAPLPVAESGNVNADANHIIDIFDVIYLIEHIFSGGPPPPP